MMLELSIINHYLIDKLLNLSITKQFLIVIPHVPDRSSNDLDRLGVWEPA